MARGKRDARLSKMLFGSPSNASSSFSRFFAIVFSGCFFKTWSVTSSNRLNVPGGVELPS